MTIRPVATHKLPANFAGQLGRLSFVDWIDKPAFAYQDIDEWRAVVDRVLDTAFPAVDLLSEDTGRRRLVERDILRRMVVCWRAKGYGSAFQTQPVSQPLRDKQIDVLRPFIQRICRRAVRWVEAQDDTTLASLSVEKGYPIRKGKGAPFFLTAQDADLVPALVRVHEGGSIVEANWRCERIGGYGTPMVGGTYIRLQAGKKPRQRWKFDGRRLIYVGEDYWGPKVRKVTGLPFAWNFWQAPVFALAREGYVASTRRGSGTLNHVISLMTRPHGQAVAVDASNFDDSVGLPAIDEIIEHLFDPITFVLQGRGILSMADAQRARDSVRVASRTAVLTPPDSYDVGAYLLQNTDGVLSGLRGTSVIDTIFTAAVVEWLGSQSGQRLGVDYDYDTFGDDTIVFTYAGGSTALGWINGFEAAKDSIGVVYERAPEATFLFRRIPSLKPYLGRMLLRSINREEREEPETLEAAVLGIAGRRDLLTGDPTSQRIYIESLKRAGGPDGRLRIAASLAEVVRPSDYPRLASAAARNQQHQLKFFDTLVEQQLRGVLPGELMGWAETAGRVMYRPWKEIKEASYTLSEDRAATAIRKRMSQQADEFLVRKAVAR